MTYKLNPIIELITCPVVLVFPYGARHEYRSGKAAAELNYNENYEIKRIYAVNEKVEIELQPTEILGKNWDREE